MSDTIARLNTALEGRYAIERELGEGGMATVYLAQDVRHDRKVALKVLKPALAAVMGAERFLAEIKTTANLQHPHILPLFDSGEADGFLFYVMPFVVGETLRDRLDRDTQLPVDDAVAIASSVAGALDYAHRQGVVHRDIKPANILFQDGQPVVGDFGIALAVGAAGGSRLTETGLSVGTPHYMSPEQATGDQRVGPATDMYALGCVLYEMLIGEPPFTGATAQAILGKIIQGEPTSATSLRPSIPYNVDAAIRHALEKLPADRFTSASRFAAALNDPAFVVPDAVHTGMAAPRDWRARLAVPLVVLASMLALALAWALRRPEPSQPGERFAVAMPSWGAGIFGFEFALSPDGSAMVYTGPGEGSLGQLWLRRRNELLATPIQGSEGASGPAISPDGLEVAWVRPATRTGGSLMVASLQGGAPRVAVDFVNSFGIAWDRSGGLYFARVEGIRRVLVGGTEEVVTVADREAGETVHGWMDVLPAEKGAVFRLGRVRGSYIAAIQFETGAVTELARGTNPRYSPTGHLLWLADGAVMAAPFDEDDLTLTGPAVQVLDGGPETSRGVLGFALSESGTLLYQTGGVTGQVEPVWVDRSGTVREIEPGWRLNHPPRGRGGVALSPDGARLAVGILGATVDVWVKQLDSGPLARLTFEGELNARPFWLPGGRSIGFMSNRGGRLALWQKRADGSGAAQVLWQDDAAIQQGSVSPDGKWLLYRTGSAAGNRDIFAIQLDADSAETALATTPFAERAAMVSPDGRWFVYVSDESGRDEVYVRPFPNADDGRWQVSTAGGLEPRWAHSGRELFYRNADRELVAVEVTTEPTFSAGRQRVLFSTRGYASDFQHVLYDVSPDDQRFVLLREVPTEAGQLIWVQNFFEELKAKMANE